MVNVEFFPTWVEHNITAKHIIYRTHSAYVHFDKSPVEKLFNYTEHTFYLRLLLKDKDHIFLNTYFRSSSDNTALNQLAESGLIIPNYSFPDRECVVTQLGQQVLKFLSDQLYIEDYLISKGKLEYPKFLYQQHLEFGTSIDSFLPTIIKALYRFKDQFEYEGDDNERSEDVNALFDSCNAEYKDVVWPFVVETCLKRNSESSPMRWDMDEIQMVLLCRKFFGYTTKEFDKLIMVQRLSASEQGLRCRV